MPHPTYTVDEIVERGMALYERAIRSKVEEGNKGKFLVINIETGEYEIDSSHLAASDRAAARHPDAPLFAMRIGYPALGRIYAQPPYALEGFASSFRSSGVTFRSVTVKSGTVNTVGWLPDFKDPVTMLDPTFNGKNIVPTNNVNMSQLDDTAVNAAIEKAKRIKNVEARYAAWGRVDRMITERAAVIPWLWSNVPNVVSDRIVPAKSLANVGLLDLSATSIK